MAKERVEVLLEEIKDSVKAVANGHQVLSNKIDRLDEKFTKEINDIKIILKFQSSELKAVKDDVKVIKDDVRIMVGKIDSIDQKLDSHIQQPSHV